MNKPIIKSGRFSAGADLQCGENVVVNVAEEVVVGDRVVLPDNAYLCGRRISIGSDFYGYSWQWRRLDVGRGRIDEEDAILTVGNRATFHDNRIDLSLRVTIGDDVGLSPDVVVYTHGYWLSPLEGYPCQYAPVEIHNGVIIGFRSVLLPGSRVYAGSVVGAQSVVAGWLNPKGIYAGNPARLIREVTLPIPEERKRLLKRLVAEYARACEYRGGKAEPTVDYPFVYYRNCRFDVDRFLVNGEEDADTDDIRLFLFKRGIRLYTKRPFKQLGRVR